LEGKPNEDAQVSDALFLAATLAVSASFTARGVNRLARGDVVDPDLNPYLRTVLYDCVDDWDHERRIVVSTRKFRYEK
jgi:hypothetical protein